MKSCVFFFLIILITLNGSSQVLRLSDGFPENRHVSLSVHMTRYDTGYFNSVIIRSSLKADSDDIHMQFEGSTWAIHKKLLPVKSLPGAYDFEYTFRCTAGESPSTSVSADITFYDWSDKNYVLMPASVYNGNRVKSMRHSYCPFLVDYNDIGPEKPQIISDVPRLNIDAGPSRIQQRSGDMSTPAIGFYSPKNRQGFWLLTEQASQFGDNGLDIEENSDRTNAVITLTAPVVRERYRYFISDMQYPSTDKPVNFIKGDSVKLKGRIFFFSSPDVQSLYNEFALIRNMVVPKGKAPLTIPFSSAFKLQEEKFNRQNFEPSFGYYSVGLRENYFQDWQIGWVGGMITTYPLLVAGNEQSRKNVIRNFNWLFPSGISPSGYFWDSGAKGTEWFGIFQMFPQAKDLHLVRKSADALYYILKQFAVFKQLNIPVKSGWEQGLRTVADAFVKTWKTYGQLGQYVNNKTGELIIGGSTSAAIAPAALMLASKYYNNPGYRIAAEQIAAYYYQNYVIKGMIYGGPGDALQNFDSESAYGMLESFTELYEQTGDRKWLQMAEEMAIQYVTWISSYDYKFPAKSTLGKLNKKTTGVVWANTQNKHGAPGICTHSGVAFLRLYRATGNAFYLDLLRDIARAIPQYLSTKENPIPGLQPGWISERVSTTDWLEGIGEIMNGTTWAETSLMLTSIELPGIYVDLTRNVSYDFDQVEISSLRKRNGRTELTIKNPTQYDASIKILAESATEQKSELRTSFLTWKNADITAGKSVTVKLN
jgi:hypothetical protein